MAKKSVLSIFDFRGGYATDLPPQLMADNESLVAENVFWQEGLEKRGGRSLYASVLGSALRGGHRVLVNGTWTSFLAYDMGSGVAFYQGHADSFASVNRASGSSFLFTAGKPVRFDHLGDKIVAVNGTDRPAIFWASGGAIYANDLERYDERERANDNWYAGFYASSTYTDDTTDAQSASATDFLLATSTATSGFWVACDFTYTKLLFTGCDAITGTLTAVYQYYDGATWTNIGTVNATPNWGSSGDHVLEFEIPMDSAGNVLWAKYDASEGNLTDRYVARVLFTGQTNSPQCGQIAVSHTHYLSQIMGDQRPHEVRTHKSTLFLVAGNQVQIGLYNDVTGWRSDRWEYFQEGGAKIIALVPHDTYLAVVKESAIHAIDGTSWQNWTTRKLCDGGTVAPGGVLSSAGRLWHVARDGIYAWDGTRRYLISKHIRSDFDAWTHTDVDMVEYKGNIYIAFPTNSTVLHFDPDTFRLDPMGDGRVSFFKFPSYRVDQFLYCRNSDDTGYLLALVNGPYVARLDTNQVDNVSGTAAINLKFQSKFFGVGGDQVTKYYSRVKPKVGQVSVTGQGTYTFKLLTDDEYGGASSPATLVATLGSGFHTQDVSVPYEMDGKLLAFEVEHAGLCKAKIFGFAIDSGSRGY